MHVYVLKNPKASGSCFFVVDVGTRPDYATSTATLHTKLCFPWKPTEAKEDRQRWHVSTWEVCFYLRPTPGLKDGGVFPGLAVWRQPERTEVPPQSSLPLSILHILTCPLLLISSVRQWIPDFSISLHKTFSRPRCKVNAWHSHCSR